MAARKARSPQLSRTTWCFCWKEGDYRFQVQPGRHRQEWWLKEGVVVVVVVVAKSCPTFCNPMDYSTPGFLVLYHFPEFTQTHVHWVSETTQTFHLLSSPSPPAFSLSQHQGLFQWVSPSQQVAKVLELQPQHQSFQWILKEINKWRAPLKKYLEILKILITSKIPGLKYRE